MLWQIILVYLCFSHPPLEKFKLNEHQQDAAIIDNNPVAEDFCASYN